MDEILSDDFAKQIADIENRLQKLEKCCEALRGLMSPNNLKRLVEKAVEEDVRRLGRSRG